MAIVKPLNKCYQYLYILVKLSVVSMTSLLTDSYHLEVAK